MQESGMFLNLERLADENERLKKENKKLKKENEELREQLEKERELYYGDDDFADDDWGRE